MKMYFLLFFIFELFLLRNDSYAVNTQSTIHLDDDPLNLVSITNTDSKKTDTLFEMSDMEKQLSKCTELMYDSNDPEKFNAGLENLNKFITEHPSYAHAYFKRAYHLYNYAGSKDYSALLSDLNEAIKNYPTTKRREYEDTAEAYSLRAKVYRDISKLDLAMKDLETAVNINYRDAIDNSGKVSPQAEPTNRQWSKKDFDNLIRKRPNDYRCYLFRAIYYYKFGILLEPRDYERAIADFNNASRLNPNYALTYYLLGQILDERIMWGKRSKQAYQNEAKFISQGLSIWNAYPEDCKKIDRAYTAAIKANPIMKEAYLARATLYLNTQKPALAIKDYSKAIELDPDYGGAYHDRGLAHSSNGEYWKAIDDFTSAINAKKQIASQYLGYENRAKAYSSNNQLKEAISDYTQAIKSQIESVIFIMSLSQIRTIYSEYNKFDDKNLLKMLHDKYYPAMELDAFSEHLINNNGTAAFIVSELLESRGDIYLRDEAYKRAIEDYKKALSITPTFQIDRWKYLTAGGNAKWFLDINTVEINNSEIYYWVKVHQTKSKPKEVSYSIERSVIDCTKKKMRILSAMQYNSAGDVISSFENPSEWRTFIPDTVGETLYNGWCRE